MGWTVNPDHGYLDWIDGLGGSKPIVNIDVDTNTPPGTDPVVADGTNTIAVTGGQIANASLANVIRTHSYVANSFTVEIQQSGSAAAEDTSLNGVSHFNSDHFSVSNGFVSLVGGSSSIDSIGVDATSGTGTDPVLPDGDGLITVTGGQVNASVVGANVIRTISTQANEYTIEIQQAGATAAANTDANGVAHFDSAQFTVTTGYVQITNFSPFNYVQIDNTDSPYAATSTDFYISCDSSGGLITVQLPNAPTDYRMFVIKDRTGSASGSNITITTVGGVVTIDGATSQTLASNYGSLTLLFNGSSYEIY